MVRETTGTALEIQRFNKRAAVHHDRRKYWIGDEMVEQRRAARNKKHGN